MDIQGRRVLFVDPPSVVQEQMILFLVTAQHEAAIVKDPHNILSVVRRFPRSIVYFNIDSRLSASELEQIIREVLDTRSGHGAEVGILSYNENADLARHYLMELGVSCGYVTLSLGFEKSARIVLKALGASEAQGSRQYVRVKVPTGKAGLNITSDSGRVRGTIIDISVVGIAAILSADYPTGTRLENVQLQLWGTLLTVSATIAGTRKTPLGAVSVMMFDEINDSLRRGKIYTFLKRVMQHEVDAAS